MSCNVAKLYSTLTCLKIEICGRLTDLMLLKGHHSHDKKLNILIYLFFVELNQQITVFLFSKINN